MWVMLNDAFLSIVKKDCPEDSLLVRARRPGDIEKVFGRRIKVTRATNADYLYRAVVPRTDVENALVSELGRVTYGNFKDSVQDHELHDAYLKVWTAMSTVQDPGPYSTSSFIGNHAALVDSPKKKKRNGKKKHKPYDSNVL